jgi:hypothetical protein
MMKAYALGAIAALTLLAPATAGAAVFHIGDPNFFITSGTPFTPSITAAFYDGFNTTTTFDDSFQFTIPQNGSGSGSISTSFSNATTNKLTISDLIINGVSYASLLHIDASGESGSVGGIPIMNGMLNTIEVKGSTNGSGAYDGTMTFTAAAVPEASIWGMMIVGFGLVGVSFRRRPTRVSFA